MKDAELRKPRKDGMQKQMREAGTWKKGNQRRSTKTPAVTGSKDTRGHGEIKQEAGGASMLRRMLRRRCPVAANGPAAQVTEDGKTA